MLCDQASLYPGTCAGSISHPFIHYLWEFPARFNSSPSEQNGRHFAVDILKRILFNEKLCTFIQISLKFVPKDKPSLVYFMAITWTNDDPAHGRIYAALGVMS